MGHVVDLTDAHEQSSPQPWAMTDAPDEYVARMLLGLAEAGATKLAHLVQNRRA
jgi:predicted FMN-binding regulatory protein PaiB